MVMEKTAYLFAGQGSQYIGMGKDFYQAFAASKRVFDQADEVLGFSLSGLMFSGSKEELTKTNNSQPAILTMSIAALEAYKTVVDRWSLVVGYTAGLSLGEYSALVASGAISFGDAVYLVRRRGEFMEEEAQKRPGRMLSVIGLGLEVVKEICLEAHTEIANINCPGQIVVSGGIKEIEAAQGLAKVRAAKMAIPLEVGGAFHSSFMQGASLRLEAELSRIKIGIPAIPVVSNVTGRPITSIQEIKGNLVKQVASCVLWEDSMKFLLGQGIMNFIEFGPGKVLKGLMRSINPEAKVINIEKQEDVLAFSV